MILSESYDGFVARRKARELAGSWFDTEVLKRHLLVAKLNKVGGNKNSSEYTSYLINIAAISDEQFYACLFLHTAGDRYKECRTTLETNFTMGSEIPTTVEDSYTLLQKNSSRRARIKSRAVEGQATITMSRQECQDIVFSNKILIRYRYC